MKAQRMYPFMSFNFLLLYQLVLSASPVDVDLSDYDSYDTIEETSSVASVETSTQATKRDDSQVRRESSEDNFASVTASTPSGDETHKFITVKRSVPPIQQQSTFNSIGDELFCMRTSRSNCQPMTRSQLTASSVWHCLSTRDSPSCICTCDGSCEPLIVKVPPGQSLPPLSPPPQSRQISGAGDGQLDQKRPCDDCSCLSASIGSCICTPGC